AEGWVRPGDCPSQGPQNAAEPNDIRQRTVGRHHGSEGPVLPGQRCVLRRCKGTNRLVLAVVCEDAHSIQPSEGVACGLYREVETGGPMQLEEMECSVLVNRSEASEFLLDDLNRQENSQCLSEENEAF